jgi:hypothetical protein
MTIGLNYGAHSGNTYTSYLAATTDLARGMGMGLVYWPGLRFGDSYSIESLGSNGQLTNNSVTGVAQLKWGYGFGTVPSLCLSATDDATADGTLLELATCSGSTSQSWAMSS